MKKTNGLPALVLLAAMLFSLLSSCSDNITESFDTEDKSRSEWEKYTFMVDEFSFNELNTKTGKTLKKTANRLIKLDNETDELSYVCIDPVCTHEPYSGCPLVSLKEMTCSIHSVGDWLVFTAKSGSGTANEKTVNLYNLKTGELRTIIRDFSENESLSVASRGNDLYCVVPDLKKDKTVYLLKHYTPNSDKWKTLAEFDEKLTIMALSNKRIYISRLTYDEAYSTSTSFSLDYSGKNRREEPEMKMAIAFKKGSICYGSEYRDLMITEDFGSRVFAGYYKKYDVVTGEKARIPSEDGATVLGVWGDKLVYATCKDLEVGVGLNPYEYARENGLEIGDPSVKEAVNKLRNEIFFGDKMYIKICDMNGNNSEVLYEYPGIFFDTGTVSGDYMKVKGSMLDENGIIKNGEYRINLNTGKMENVPVYSLGDIEETIVARK